MCQVGVNPTKLWQKFHQRFKTMNGNHKWMIHNPIYIIETSNSDLIFYSRSGFGQCKLACYTMHILFSNKAENKNNHAKLT